MNGVAIYCRVSTDGQELAQQVAACKRFCEFKQLSIDEVYMEVGSGKSFKREQFQRMLTNLRAAQHSSIVCFRFDRLGRNAREVAMFFDEMETKGINVFSVNENLDVSTPIGRAMRDIILRLAQLERENIAEATRQRLQALRNIGKHIGRPKGSKDKNSKRANGGYLLRWQKERGGKKGHGNNPNNRI